MLDIRKILNNVKGPFYADKRFILFVWMLLASIAGFKHATRGVFNDYLIFKSVFYHTLEEVNLYLEYPELNGDSNHYGPVFSLVFAPFALLPDALGTVLWELLMALVLFIAIYKLPIKWNAKVIIYYISLQGVYANAVNSETNTLVAAMIIGCFILIRKEKDFWAACLIALGTMIKLYGVVGFAFFFFSRHKAQLIFSFLFWSIVFFVLPMIISSPQFILQSYVDWYESLVHKNSLNIMSLNQDISVMGLVRRISGNHQIGNLFILIPALVLFLLQYININNYKDLKYQMGILSSTLLFVVLFSTGSEPCTYIIAAVGAAIWFVLQARPYSRSTIILIACAVLIIFASSGITPAFIRTDIVKRYELEALPYLIIWLVLIYQQVTTRSVKVPVHSLDTDSK